MEEKKVMSVKDVYLKTMKFNMIKLGLGAAVTAISLILLLMCGGLTYLCNNGVVTLVMFIIWIFGSCGAYKIIMNYIGYMIKAAHVAVISQAVTTGQIPENMVETGKNMVKERFVETNVYLVLDHLVSGAVKQLQKVVGNVGNALDFIPGMSGVTEFAQKFIGISLGYVDECCLGYSFLQKDKGAFEAGCDGVVIYFQNTKHLLKNAAVTTIVVMVSKFFAWMVPFLLLALIFGALQWNTTIAVVLAILIAICIKVAFIDSYMLVKMMFSYMEVAPQTEISFDLYEKLCKLSSNFKKLWEKAKAPAAA